MAKKKEEEKLNYNAELRRLKQQGPERLYLLWGQEDYLREQYLGQLKAPAASGGEARHCNSVFPLLFSLP